MKTITTLDTLQQIKVLSDTRRAAILRLLMDRPLTLTHLGDALGKHPAWIRHHLKKLEMAGLVEMADIQVRGGVVEKYYRASSRAFIIHQVILPGDPNQGSVVIMGSHDLALELLLGKLPHSPNLPELLSLPVGSLEGLIALRQGIAHLAGCHLLDDESGDYNLPFVRHLFPDRPVTLITLAHREQGLIVQSGNPFHIRNLTDLDHPQIKLINRNRGSGTRLWLDRKLKEIGISPDKIPGYSFEVNTHHEVAERIRQGNANVGLGLRAAARRFSLHFIPLFQERYDLVIPQENLQNLQIISLLDELQSKTFQMAVRDLEGYETTHTGERLSI